MKETREELIALIEKARKRLNASIDAREGYDVIYQYSIELDKLIEEYILAGY